MEIGILVPLLAIFLTSERQHHSWLKVYVVYVNLLSLAQTAFRVILAFDALDPGPPLAAVRPSQFLE